eukprot:TRINITY_DN22828_c0_g1_i1.p2 TRINITY_DN22828_c0_g1~~TRINITY_DN22828_c0_g1_i1.p2  ORF type:complete len:130 (-),score=6.74 TRINITY_DN22828_c0_g1_i1:44-433(-)
MSCHTSPVGTCAQQSTTSTPHCMMIQCDCSLVLSRCDDSSAFRSRAKENAQTQTQQAGMPRSLAGMQLKLKYDVIGLLVRLRRGACHCSSAQYPSLRTCFAVYGSMGAYPVKCMEKDASPAVSARKDEA